MYPVTSSYVLKHSQSNRRLFYCKFCLFIIYAFICTCRRWNLKGTVPKGIYPRGLYWWITCSAQGDFPFIVYAYICTCKRWHCKESVPKDITTRSAFGKQNVQAKYVHWITLDCVIWFRTPYLVYLFLIEKDHLCDWSPETNCSSWLTFRQPVRKPSSVHLGFKPFSYLVYLLLPTISSSCSLYCYFFFQRSVVLPRDFPSEEVFEAYLHPVVDESTEQFEWGKPDLHSLRLYPLWSCWQHFPPVQKFLYGFQLFFFSWDRYADELKRSLFVVFHNSISSLFALISLSVRICLSQSTVANAFFFRWALLLLLLLLFTTEMRSKSLTFFYVCFWQTGLVHSKNRWDFVASFKTT